ncbi:endonuclease [Ancylomarina sp. 16SWW S1-10-2]|uniref:endonuclease n=1 Tax=Ancylomarina sp. 16SWW S1-10-2 TaxID=2499681 RepID=UPI0012AD90FD|nr:endonuclease [Ancylomarina sp. 16SWW S1-10-2]MRT92175.1 T9SS type A sorting domain-containing protein [Ancylomarina sp. 16SWW S1-10-2]
MMKFLYSRFFLPLTFLAAISFSSMAQTSIEEYYQNATGKTGGELKTALHFIIHDHTELPYTSKDSDDEYNVWEALKITDEDPNNSDNILLIYTGRSEAKSNQDNGDGGDLWNREHIWAKSHGDFGTDRGAGTDIHHLRPSDASVNSDRSNLFFDDGGQAHSEATECNYDDDSWEPRDAIKGDVARMIFYMAVCYEGENGDPDLEMTEDMTYSKDNYTAPYFGKLSTLIDWNTQDPVDDAERARNEKVYTIQGNRNPFINHPEWVNAIWVDTDNNSPMATDYSPENGDNTVSLTSNLKLTFNEKIQAGTGNVVIKRFSDDSEFESLDITGYPRVVFTNNTVYINPLSMFEEGTKYYITITSGAITDASANIFEGISDKNTWSFTATYPAPVISDFTPVNNSVNIPINTDLQVTFDKNVVAGSGNVSIQTNGIEVQSIQTSTASIDGKTVTIQLSEELEGSTKYSVLIDENAFLSENGATFEGITSDTDWTFTTEVIEVEVITGIEESVTEGTPSFYPNPADNEIRLINIDNVQSINFTDLSGRSIMQIKPTSTRINIDNLPQGMYLVTFISNDESTVTKKLLKQ